jgi:hypothetical protein
VVIVTVAAEQPYRTAECRSTEIEHGLGISSSQIDPAFSGRFKALRIMATQKFANAKIA